MTYFVWVENSLFKTTNGQHNFRVVKRSHVGGEA